MNELVITCAAGTEPALEEELRELDLAPAGEGRGVRRVAGGLDALYRVAMEARVASRALMPLTTFRADDPDALYEAARALPWEAHLDPEHAFVVDCVTSARRRQDHTRFLAQRTKDAIVDRIRDRRGARPSVDKRRPDLRVHVRWAREVTISLDPFGPLHRRGYRPQGAAAPLRESLAAAILRLAGWRPGEPLVDPMCGSGTFLAEAAGRVRDVAPGLSRRLGGWKGHEGAAWSALVRDARDRKDAAALRPLQLHGRDADPEAVAMAREALLRAGFPDLPVQVQALEDQAAPEGPPGHVLVNPPYGERLGARGELVFLYARLGDVLKRRFPGWTAHVLAGEPDLLKHVGLRADAKRTLFNGPLEARLATYRIHARAPESAPEEGPGWRKASEESQAFANRVKKNRTRLGRWAKRHGIHVWRVYDADIPEFNVAVDLYEGVGVVVQEYARPKKVDPMVADRRLRDVMLRVPELLDVDEKDVHLRVRAKQGAGQYGKRADEGERHEVIEAGLRFGVNLTDYLDTGLFADQRELRARAAEAAGERGGEGGGARFLNLFAYTCSASVHAAARGASTTSVDLSRTYLDWGEESFRRNGLDPAAHAFVRADVERFLADVGSARWDVIYLNPPSFSRSKAMEGDFVVARDHGPLIEAAMKALAPGGVLFFSTHARGFRLDDALERRFDVRDIGREVVPRDFQRSPFRAYALRARP